MRDLVNFVKEHKIITVINLILLLFLLWFVVSWFDVISSNGIDGVGCHYWNLFKILFN